jgi:uncharacterized protein (PEP-CTERM system associated)
MTGGLLVAAAPAAVAQESGGASGSYGGLPATGAPPPSAGAVPGAAETAAAAGAAEGARRPAVQFRVGLEETFTDNVGLEPSSTRRGDAVTRLSPAMNVHLVGARTLLQGDVSLPVLLYARTGGENNRIVPAVDLLGRYEAVERLVFVEAAAHVSQSYFSPFQPTSTAIENNPSNAYTAQSYRLSPYIRHESSNYTYELRNNSIWTVGTNVAAGASDAYTNETVASLRRQPRPLGWEAEYRRHDVQFQDAPSQVADIARLSGVMRATTDLELRVAAGYERYRIPFANEQGFIYGASARWRPSPRTSLDVGLEHHFFGPAYRLSFENRRPLSLWSVEATRQVTSYPQALATVPAGDVSSFLDRLFGSRVPNAAERQQRVNEFIADRGLPQTLTGPVEIFSRQVRIETRIGATVGLVGARNSVFLRAFRLRTQPLGTSEIVDVVGAPGNDSTQVGGEVTWSHQLAPLMTLTADATQRYGRSEREPFGASRTTSLSTHLSYKLSAKTTARAGARYQRQRSDFSPGYDEAAVFAGILYLFH